MKRTLYVLSKTIIPTLQKKAPLIALLFLGLLIALLIYFNVYGYPFQTETIEDLLPPTSLQKFN